MNFLIINRKKKSIVNFAESVDEAEQLVKGILEKEDLELEIASVVSTFRNVKNIQKSLVKR